MEYFKRENLGCFICSLANAILAEFNDINTAKLICRNSKTHPLVLGDYTLAGTWPFLASELSGQRYSGTLYATPDIIPSIYKVPESVEESKKELYIQAIDMALTEEKINLEGHYTGNCPVLLAISREEDHVVVMLDKWHIIDNGFLRKISLARLVAEGHSIDGFFKVEKDESKMKKKFVKKSLIYHLE